VRFVALVLVAGCESLFGVTAPTAIDAGGDARPVSPVLVQQMTASSASATSLAVTLPNRPAAQDVLVMIGGSPFGVTSVTGGGVTWQVAGYSGVSPTQTIWYGVTDGSSATVVLAAAMQSDMWVDLTEWRGLDASLPIDGTAHNGGSGGTITGPLDLAITTQHGPDLLVFAASCFGTITTPPGSWTDLATVVAGTITQTAWYAVAGTAGAQAVHSTYRNEWDAVLVAFPTK
jgi:hypothetical protein